MGAEGRLAVGVLTRGGRLGAVAPDYACRVAVPFMDLARHQVSLSTEILRDVAELMDTGAFVNGPAVTRF